MNVSFKNWCMGGGGGGGGGGGECLLLILCYSSSVCVQEHLHLYTSQ